MTTTSKTDTQTTKREQAYRALVRHYDEHYLAVTTENDVFYMPITRKQAMQCLANGMVAAGHDGSCFIDKVDHLAEGD